ncbi:MAG TPA: aminopeptidase P family protein [Candidatus Korarchaeota archaeon]|nr:aminopeptidase P family protein [Candidatus Korarchaeota archaeon]
MDVSRSEYEGRISKLKNWMAERRVEAAVISPGSNMRYLSGTENAGMMVIPLDGEPFLVAQYAFGDGLAEQESFLEVRVIKPKYGLSAKEVVKADLAKAAAEWLRESGVRVRRLAVEKSKGGKFIKDLRKAFRKGRRRVLFVDLGDILRDMRAIKSEEEVKLIEESAKIAIAAFEEVVDELREGVSEAEVANKLEYAMREKGAEEPSFKSIVAFGEHTYNAHHVPTRKRLEKGALVLFDFGARYKGYCSDMTRTFVFGREPSGDLRERLNAVLAAQQTALQAVRGGAKIESPDIEARKVLVEKGLAEEFVHSLGHGVGLDIHEYPRLIVGAKGELREGMTVTVEPGIYIKGWGGVRFEDTVVVSGSSPRILTQALAKDLRLG